jgi:hypothetical protein
MTVVDVLTLLVKLYDVLEPVIAGIVKDWQDGKITAEEADAQAEGKFTAMVALLADPHKDAAATNAAVDAEINKKFPPTS